ncbi:ketoacyl-ACP synthase III family protein [Nocardia tengchongensis]|uniref:ketoacyl-ACP synthase III family protein n=1 Tax=Nocardia tengchongensis TaxID=2055889 RepID=UPI0036A47197
MSEPLAVVTATHWIPEYRQKPADLEPSRRPADPGYTALAVSESSSGPELAVLAGRVALTAAGWEGADVGLLLYAWSHYQGHDFWSPAHFVAAGVGANSALPLGIQQMCNGGAAAVQAAATFLRGDPRRRRALVGTGDRFAEPGFHRWTGDYGVAYGDAGTAVLLSTEPDARPRLWLHAIATVAAPQLEAMTRGDDPAAPAPRWLRGAVDVRTTKKAFLRTLPRNRYAEIERAKLTEVITIALADAGLTGDDPRLARVILPRFHADALDSGYRPLVAELTPAETVDFGRDTGHLGAGDLAAGLADLLDQHLLAPGEYALVLSAGVGFSWSCAVVSRPVPTERGGDPT